MIFDKSFISYLVFWHYIFKILEHFLNVKYVFMQIFSTFNFHILVQTFDAHWLHIIEHFIHNQNNDNTSFSYANLPHICHGKQKKKKKPRQRWFVVKIYIMCVMCIQTKLVTCLPYKYIHEEYQTFTCRDI